MYIPYNYQYKEKARELRKNMTREERKLWYLYLKDNKYRFLLPKQKDSYRVRWKSTLYCKRIKV